MALKTNINYELNDSQLVYMINENNEDAKDKLYQKYSALIHKEVNQFKNKAQILGIDSMDLFQEALLGFSNAISSYNDNEDTKFITYATLCIRRKLINFINKHSTIKSQTMNNTISLDDENNNIIRYIKDLESKEPLNSMITDEELKEVGRKFKNLNEKERRVLEYSIEGIKPEEIAKLEGMNVKQVYNILYRTRQKIKID